LLLETFRTRGRAFRNPEKRIERINMPRLLFTPACRAAGILIALYVCALASSARAATRPAITIMNDKGMAPFAVHVNALSSDLGGSDDPLTVRYDWDFGDDKGQFNTLTGWNAAHIYDSAGTYTIRLKITDKNGHKSSETHQVVVSGAHRSTIYVAEDGDDSNPGTQSKPIRTVARAGRLLRTNNSAIMFRRGSTYNLSRPLEISESNVLIGAYGSGAMPTLNWTAGDSVLSIFEFTADARNVVVQNIRFTSSTNHPDLSTVRALHPAGQNLTVRNCRFSDVSYAMNCEQDISGLLALRNQCDVVGAYFSWAEGSDHTYIGNTCMGSRSQHVIRFGGLDRCLIAHNKITNNTNSTVWAMIGSYAYIADNTLKNGRCIVGPNRAVGSPSDRFNWAVMENNHITNEGLGVEAGTDHVVLRNNIIERDADSSITVFGYVDNMDRSNSDIRIYNNTAINNDASGRFVSLGARMHDVVVANNMYIARRMETGLNQTANVFLLDGTMDGVRFRNNLWSNPAVVGWGKGWHYAFDHWSDAQGYKNRNEWAACSQCSKERYRSFASDDLDNNFKPTFDADLGIAMPGVQQDFSGKARDLHGKVTVGAIESASDHIAQR
jgi:hypothetical protein